MIMGYFLKILGLLESQFRTFKQEVCPLKAARCKGVLRRKFFFLESAPLFSNRFNVDIDPNHAHVCNNVCPNGDETLSEVERPCLLDMYQLNIGKDS